jgi:hypothetical protein
LDEGDFSPYQLLGKAWMQPGIVSYDILFRLVDTIDALRKYKVKVSPLDWLRQRLIDLVAKEGEKFALTKTVKDLYSDSHVVALRNLSGFRTIGRPSRAHQNGTPKASKRVRKRTAVSSPAPGSSSKRRHVALDDGIPNYDGYTDTDSVCKEEVNDLDFRIVQVKTQDYATRPSLTQYWHYADVGDLEHQMLRSMDPPVWEKYNPPIDFDVPLDCVDLVTHHPNTLRVHLEVTAGREGKHVVMAQFKRERTKGRFLALCHSRQMPVEKASE